MRLLVIGYGNPMAGDDSAGVEILRRLAPYDQPECRLKLAPCVGLDLLDCFPDADTIVLVDAVASGSEAGTVHLVPLPADALESASLSKLSGHGWGIRETLDLAVALGRRVPRILLVGIEAGTMTLGATRSEPVERAIEMVVEKFPQLLCCLRRSEEGFRDIPRQFGPGDELFPGG